MSGRGGSLIPLQERPARRWNVYVRAGDDAEPAALGTGGFCGRRSSFCSDLRISINSARQAENHLGTLDVCVRVCVDESEGF